MYKIIKYYLEVRLNYMNYFEKQEELKKCQNRITFLSFLQVREDAKAYWEEQDRLKAIKKKMSTIPKEEKEEEQSTYVVPVSYIKKPKGVYLYDLS